MLRPPSRRPSRPPSPSRRPSRPPSYSRCSLLSPSYSEEEGLQEPFRRLSRRSLLLRPPFCDGGLEGRLICLPAAAHSCCLHARYATLRYATLRYATLRYATLRFASLRYATLPHYINNNIILYCSPCSARREAQGGSERPPVPPGQWPGEHPVIVNDDRFAERSLPSRHREPARELGRGNAKLSVPPSGHRRASIRELQHDDDDANVKPASTTSGGAPNGCDDWRVGVGGSNAPSH